MISLEVMLLNSHKRQSQKTATKRWKWLIIALIAATTPTRAFAQPTDDMMTLQEALALAFERNPELTVFPVAIRAAEARLLQAGVRVNPELTLAVEDFAGTGEFSGTQQTQSTLQLGQLIELGGKRGARRGVADAELGLIGTDYELKRLEVLADVTARFIEVLGAQNTLELRRQAAAASERLSANALERREAGKGTPLEERRSAATVALSRSSLEQANRELTAAKQRLAATWAGAAAEFDRADGDMFATQPPVSFDELVARIEESPELERWASERRLREAELRLAKSGGVPNLNLSGGIRSLGGPGERSLVAEVSLPLPLFDRNQGGRRQAEARLEIAEMGRTAAHVRLRSVLFEMHQRLSAAAIEATTLREEVLPIAEEALEIAESGYRAGRFSYLEVSEAQRAAFDIRAQLISAAQTYHKLVAEIERLTGRAL